MNAKAKSIVFLMIIGGLGGIVVLFNALGTTTEYFFQDMDTRMFNETPPNSIYIMVVAEEPIKGELEKLLKEKFPNAVLLENKVEKVNGSLIVAYFPVLKFNSTMLKNIAEVEGVIYYSAYGNAKPMLQFIERHKENLCENTQEIKELYLQTFSDSGSLHIVCWKLKVKVGKLKRESPIDVIIENIHNDLQNFP
ncbi:hypothetical protein A3L04_00435 [Thermococcus chitonophagus]|uniref:Uncharacterized protein n=1 Tax=Thermococcus chitonophagus TaxID=54262 RepID=A0A170S9Q5_9EURY|nr:hypothetical protein [Thermococcus chitonophagus]ASJ15649.1 hypothetical protein A3L04_00435 [Thermococcus chitonophagus]CUX76858.1 hypothetical protein CHITON_0079 [Thermococcus chitonophagus]